MNCIKIAWVKDLKVQINFSNAPKKCIDSS